MPVNNFSLSPTAPVIAATPLKPVSQSADKAAETANTKTVVNPKTTDTQLKTDGYSDTEIRHMKKLGKIECQTCSSRTYVDGSDDPGVSFKSPTKLSPGEAATAVFAHEREHVSRNAAKAEREDREVVFSSVRVFRSACPECGNSYVSGGETRTQTKKAEENDHFKDKAYEEKIAPHFAKYIDEKV